MAIEVAEFRRFRFAASRKTPAMEGSMVEKIRQSMNKRFSSGKAYTIGCLWDKVRTDELVSAVNKFIGETKGERILDVGCGIGGCASTIEDCLEYTGIDISDVAIAQAAAVYNKPNFKFIAMDAQELKFPDKYFDTVIAREVIEHLQEPQKCLKEIERVLKPGGVMVLTSPNRDSLHLRVNRMLGHGDFMCSIDHIKEFSFREMMAMIKQAGLYAIDNGWDTAGIFLMPYWGIPGMSSDIRQLSDNGLAMVELMRQLGQIVGPEYAFCYVIRAIKPMEVKI